MSWIMIGAAAAVVLVLVLMYNGLIGRRNAVENAFAGMDVQLKLRYDLLPNLVAAVKQYLTHEAGTLERLTELRARAAAGGLGTEDKVALNNELGRVLRGVFVAVENYPQLRGSENIQQLQRSLNEVEDRISAARRAYNAAVLDFNNAVEMFPTNLMAGAMRLARRSMFEVPEAERQNVNVASLFKG